MFEVDVSDIAIWVNQNQFAYSVIAFWVVLLLGVLVYAIFANRWMGSVASATFGLVNIVLCSPLVWHGIVVIIATQIVYWLIVEYFEK